MYKAEKGQKISITISPKDYQKLEALRGDWTRSHAIRQLIRTKPLKAMETA